MVSLAGEMSIYKQGACFFGKESPKSYAKKLWAGIFAVLKFTGQQYLIVCFRNKVIRKSPFSGLKRCEIEGFSLI